MKIQNVFDVAAGQMCTGCGACAYFSPDEVAMVDALDLGRRPVPAPQAKPKTPGAPAAGQAALRVCPGVELGHQPADQDRRAIPALLPGWGPVIELWEGSAADQEVRFAGSSGGAATALALFGMEQAGMHGTLHIRARKDVPYLNETVLSRTRQEMLAATGSRYAPASPCDRLDLIEAAPAPCIFIGKPCDVAAVQKARALRPALDAQVGLTIAIFCAGTPSTKGTLEMLRAMGVEDPTTLKELRYRGLGWPGKAAATITPPGRYGGAEGNGDAGGTRREMSYAESWGDILQKHRQWRCYLCLDHTGEFADIAVGDPWYRTLGPDEKGESLILARTERGRAFLAAAIDAGVLDVARCAPDVLPASQGHFLPVRGSIWGRLLTLRLLGAPAPRYSNMPMFRFFWRNLTLNGKLRAFLGTARRIFRKRLRERVAVVPFQPEKARSSERSPAEVP